MTTITPSHITANGHRDRRADGRRSARHGSRAAVPRPELREIPPERWAAALSENLRTGLSGFLDFEVLEFVPGRIVARLPLRDELMMAAGDFLHAGTVVTFADSIAGWGCLATLPDHVQGFATSELKANLVATTRMPDSLRGVAHLVHGGHTTQVWDATITRESDGAAVAHFRCTQYLLSARR